MTVKNLLIHPLTGFQGTITPPGSKSIANRVLPMAALGKGAITITNVPGGEDVNLMLRALQTLGCKIKRNRTTVELQGLKGPFKTDKVCSLHLGNSGTASRFLTGLLSAGKGPYKVDGIPRLRERPIGDLVESLRSLAGPQGTLINYLSNPGYLPLEIIAGGLEGGRANIRGNTSSQFITGLLMSMPFCRKGSSAIIKGKLVSYPYVAMTLRLMEIFGVSIKEVSKKEYILEKPAMYTNPKTFNIEPDASSASYFLAAGAIAGGPITVKGISTASLQGESKFARVLARMGARVVYSEDSITVSAGNLKGIDINMDKMTDTGMTLAVTALFAKGSTRIRKIGNWRVKETDRLAAMAQELKKLGAGVLEGNDFLIIHPPDQWRKASIKTYNDHRMAMCFSLAAFCGKPITIENPECVQKTYPRFFQDFFKLVSA
jgi:3-phosphoshikimate 1-carboxyvinyltransferase